MNKMADNKNKGFSLVELIVVVTIVSILSTGMITGVINIYNANVDSAAIKLVSLLGRTRQEAIIREDSSVWLKLHQDASGDYYATIIYNTGTVETVLQNRKIGNSSLKIRVKDTSGVQTAISSGIAEAQFHFKKSNGSLVENYTDIFVEGSQTKNIILIKETGRSILD